jgi:hypothetical protein
MLTPGELKALCLRLARFRLENKELLSFLLFDEDNPAAFIAQVKQEMQQQFAHMNPTHIYLAKKSLRKAARTLDKYIRFAASRQTEVELRLFFCLLMKDSRAGFMHYAATAGLYQRQVGRIQKALLTLHEDLQYDYGQQLGELS